MSKPSPIFCLLQCVTLHFLIQRSVWRETDHRSPPDQIRSVFNAKWDQGFQLQKARGYVNTPTVKLFLLFEDVAMWICSFHPVTFLMLCENLFAKNAC